MLAHISFQWEESAHTWQVEESSTHSPLVDSELIELVGHWMECCLARCSVFGRPSPLGSTLLKLRDSSSSHRGADVCIRTTDGGREVAHAAILRARAPALWSQMVSRATKSGEWLCVKPKYGGQAAWGHCLSYIYGGSTGAVGASALAELHKLAKAARLGHLIAIMQHDDLVLRMLRDDLRSDLRALVENAASDELCDFKLRCVGPAPALPGTDTVFSVHKAMMCNSDFFDAMFGSSMRESTERRHREAEYRVGMADAANGLKCRCEVFGVYSR